MAFLAKEAGCDFAKFQHHLPEFEMLRDIPMSSNMHEPLFDFLKKNALTIQEHVELKEYCDLIGIEYLCTPFSREAAIELETYVSPALYKIGSGELTDLPSLRIIAEFNKPMIVSTGMSIVPEIDETYDLLVDQVPQLVLMNCTSAYPPKATDIFLAFIPEMKNRYPKAIIGHSDHMPSIYTSLGAVALGSMMVEKHVTIDSNLKGPDDSVSISFHEIGRLVRGVQEIFEGLNSEKRLLESEVPIQSWARRSLVYLRDLPPGSILSRDDIWGKRPGTGIPAKYYEQFVGRTVKRAVKKDTLLNQEDLEV
jgi:N-acetylneuraminate synthase